MDSVKLEKYLRALKSNGINKGLVAKTMGVNQGYLSDMMSERKVIPQGFIKKLIAEYGNFEEVTKGEIIKRENKEAAKEDISIADRAIQRVTTNYIIKMYADFYKIPEEEVRMKVDEEAMKLIVELSKSS